MWGEIETPVKAQPSSWGCEDGSKLPEKQETESQKFNFKCPVDTQPRREDTQVGSSTTFYVYIVMCPLLCSVVV